MSHDDPSVLVIGSAHMDIIGMAPESPGIDLPGKIHYGFGGTGLNIAIGLRNQRIQTRLLTAMGRGGVNRMIVKTVEDAGIDIWPYWCEIGDSGFMAITKNGDMQLAVNSTPMDRVLIPDSILVRAMSGIDALVIDANLGPEMIALSIEAANESGIPVFGSGVASAKILRMMTGYARPHVLFSNKMEMDYALDALGEPLTHGVSSRTQSLAENLRMTLVVTEGAEGVRVYSPGEDPVHIPVPFRFDFIPGSLLGLGDALMSGSIARHLLCKGNVPLSHCIAEAQFDLQTVIEKIGANDKMETIGTIFDKLHNEAVSDGLTGLMNKREGHHILQKEMDRARQTGAPLSIVFIDLDGFKKVNDTLGHLKGDAVLVEAARIIHRNIRATIDSAVRMGGDEFMIILPSSDIRDAERLAQRIEQDDWKGIGMGVEGFGASIGVGQWDGILDLGPFLDKIDKSMYEEKKRRKGSR